MTTSRTDDPAADRPRDRRPSTVDVTAFARWYRCEPCEVSWHGTDTTCWCCLSSADVSLHYPERGKDLAQATFTDPSPGTRLTRFGSNVDPLPRAATG